MSLKEDLQRIQQRRDSGDLAPEQYEAEKSRLLDACVSRIETWRQKPAAVGKPQVIRGIARSLRFADLKETATFWLDSQRVIVKGLGHPISMAPGDRMLLVGALKGEVFQATFYINESNGDNSVDSSRRMVRKTIMAGVVGMAGSAAVLAAAGIVAFREPAFLSNRGAAGGAARIAISLLSTAMGILLGWISFFVLAAGAFLSSMLEMIGREHRVS